MSALARGMAASEQGRFLAVGLISAAVDVVALVLFRDGFGLPLWLATVLALSVTFAVNFGLNATWVFGAQGIWARRAGRYAALVGLNFVLTVGIVVGLASLALWYVAAKVVAIATCAVVNFLAYRHWVFS